MTRNRRSSMASTVLALGMVLPGTSAAVAQGNDGGTLGSGKIDNHRYEVVLETPAGPRVDVSTPVSTGIWTPLVRWDSRDDGENNGLCRGQRWQRFGSEEEARQAQRDAQNAYNRMWSSLISWELPGTDPTADCPVDPAEALPPVSTDI